MARYLLLFEDAKKKTTLILTLIHLRGICRGWAFPAMPQSQNTDAAIVTPKPRILFLNSTLYPSVHTDQIFNGRGSRNPGSRNSRSIFAKAKDIWKKFRNRGKESERQWDLSREEAFKLYEKYYDCLQKRREKAVQIEEGKLMPVHAILALQGERVTMKCTVCSRPDQDKLSQQARWHHVRRIDSSVGPIGLQLNSRITLTQDAMTIPEAKLEDAGQYTCLDSEGRIVALYQLDVRIREIRKMILVGEAVLNTTLLSDHNLQLITAWSPWGACDSCGVQGIKQRHGTCVVRKLNSGEPVKPKDIPMMLLYPDGIPCHSTALPSYIRHLKEVQDRYEETLVDRCLVHCPTKAAPVVVTDKNGKVVDVLLPGEYFNLNEKPRIPKITKRRVQYEEEGKHLILQCSDIERGAGVRWMRDKRRIDPMSIRRQTEGRVWVDSANRLHIGTLLLSDTAVYNCWEREKHVVSIKILVIDAFQKDLKDYVTYAGFSITILVCLIAFCCIVVRGDKKRAR